MSLNTPRSPSPLTVRMKALSGSGLLLACVLLSGCATNGDASSSLFVDPSRYDLYDCKQLNDARKPAFDRVAELQGLMAKAESSTGGQLVSGLAYQSDFVQARAQLDLIDQTRRRGNCGDATAAGTPAPAVAAPVKKRKRSAAQ